MLYFEQVATTFLCNLSNEHKCASGSHQDGDLANHTVTLIVGLEFE